MSIEKSHRRFKGIIKGNLRKNLQEHIRRGERIIQNGKDSFSVPAPEIDIPRFRFGKNDDDNGQGGIGQGDNDGEGKPAPGDGDGQKTGQDAGQKGREQSVNLTNDELAEILQEQLKLPNIKKKGKESIETSYNKYNTVGNKGPRSLVHVKRTFKEALKRNISSGDYDPEKTVVIPIKEDFKYRQSNPILKPDNSAVIIYIMDVSGSMGRAQKEMARTMCFWINVWIRSQYKNLETRYIIHDATAEEVDEERFFSTQVSGGTLISSGYNKAKEIIEKEYTNSNIYVFQISDGDNWAEKDSLDCIGMINDFFKKYVNLFCYAQVRSLGGSGDYMKYITNNFFDDEQLSYYEMNSRGDILRAIKKFLGEGK